MPLPGLLDQVDRDTILQAINKIEENPSLRDGRESNTYDLIYDGNGYPPILILSESNQLKGGEDLTLAHFNNNTDQAFEFLSSHGFEVSDKTFLYQLHKFFGRVDEESLQVADFANSYKGIDVKVSFGSGNLARIPWIAFLREGQAVSNGVYPVYLYFKEQNLFILAYGVSETNTPSNNWELEEVESIQEYFLRNDLGRPVRYGASYVYKVYDLDHENINEEWNDDLNKIIEKYNSIDLLLDEEKEESANINNDLLPLNTILFGPPGTGKTYKLRNYYSQQFKVSQETKTRADYIRDILDDLTWWEVIAITLIEIGDSKVPEMKQHEYIRIKSSLSSAKSKNAVIWGNLQSHTIPSSESVSYSAKSEPFIFNKLDNSVWTLIEESCKENAPHLYDVVEQISNYREVTIDKNNYVFTTFHQSFTYEDFVEGIKPVLGNGSSDSSDSDVEYLIEKGIFYQSCDKACQLAGFLGLEDCLENYSDTQRREAFSNAKPYAIFIDEVNRGNIAAIFGELITLIEEDKRLTKKEELMVELPYSKKKFGVPPNLYLIGTMNTADRSVEALDSALRRRFVFEEVAPNPDLIDELSETNGILSDIYEEDSLGELLRTINKRIEKLLDKDHLIGHSYFLGIDSADGLRKAFSQKIIPLLEEYFYGDKGKIQLVLGKGFIAKVEEDESNIFAENQYDDSAIFQSRDIYHFTNDWHTDNDELAKAIRLCLNKSV